MHLTIPVEKKTVLEITNSQESLIGLLPTTPTLTSCWWHFSGPRAGYQCTNIKTHVRVLGWSLFNFDLSEQRVLEEEAVLTLSIEMDPNLLLLIMMTIVLYFFTKICLAVITAGQQRVFAVQAPELVDIRRQGAIQRRVEDITIQVEDQTINRRAENRVHPQPQENNEWNS